VTGPPLPVLADISIIDMLNAGLSKIAPAKDG
jgi:hypothetical protein